MGYLDSNTIFLSILGFWLRPVLESLGERNGGGGGQGSRSRFSPGPGCGAGVPKREKVRGSRLPPLVPPTVWIHAPSFLRYDPAEHSTLGGRTTDAGSKAGAPARPPGTKDKGWGWGWSSALVTYRCCPDRARSGPGARDAQLSAVARRPARICLPLLCRKRTHCPGSP